MHNAPALSEAPPQRGNWAAAIGLSLVALLALVVAPEVLASLDATTCGALVTELKRFVGPFIQAAQWAVGGAAIIVASWKAFQASKGNAKEWPAVIVMVVVGAFILMPGQILGIMGATKLSQIANQIVGSGTATCVTP